MPTRITSETVLLVEGNDHRNFFEAFRDHLRISPLQVFNYGGVDELSDCLTSFVKSEGFAGVRRLGIARDAEQSAQSAFQSVRSALDKANLARPDAVGAVAPGDPAVSVLVLPEDGAGMLETVLARSFAGTKEDGCIDRFFACIQRDGSKLQRPDKARTTAFLATTRNPHVSVGVAAKKEVWSFDHDAFRTIREFLSRLGG